MLDLIGAAILIVLSTAIMGACFWDLLTQDEIDTPEAYWWAGLFGFGWGLAFWSAIVLAT